MRRGRESLAKSGKKRYTGGRVENGGSILESMKLLGVLLDIGAAMIRSGAETHRVEDSLYRLTASYGFTDCNIWVVPSNIQATVTEPQGQVYTQIRHIRTMGVDFHRLDRLNSLCRDACETTPPAEALQQRLEAINREAAPPVWLTTLAAVLAGVGFGVFFRCDAWDALVAGSAAVLIAFLGRGLSRRESNPLVFNFVIALLAECWILLAVRVGIGHHGGAITVGVIMLLISALGTTNGVRDLVHLDTLSGVMNITLSLTGAIGIALGIALPLLVLGGAELPEVSGLTPDPVLQLLAATVGCTGFALWFHVRGRKVLFCALGALLTWGVYLLAFQGLGSVFLATLCGSAACGLYAQIMARVDKAPATIFMTVSVFPLIPGAALYYTMAALVAREAALARAKGIELVLVCFGIVLGYMIVEVVSKYLWPAKQEKR